MRAAALLLVAVVTAFSVPSARTFQNSSPAAPANSQAGQELIRHKYRAVQIDEFEVKSGVEFPPEYVKKAQQEMVKRFSDTKLFDRVLPTGNPASAPATPTLRLSGTIHDYNKGSRIKRYVGGFGPGAAEVEAQICFRDAATGRRLRVEELRALFTGGLFGGGDDKIADALAERVVLQASFMLDRNVPPPDFDAPLFDRAPTTAPSERHIVSMNAKTWTEGEQKLAQEATAGYRVVDFSLTGQSTADLSLEKFAVPPDVYQYRWVHIRMFTHLQKEVSKAAADGFHAVPQSLSGLGPYLTVLMEKSPGQPSLRYQYLVSEPLTLSNAQKDAGNHQREGYTLLDEIEFGAHILLFEKSSTDAGK